MVAPFASTKRSLSQGNLPAFKPFATGAAIAALIVGEFIAKTELLTRKAATRNCQTKET